jgi:hypothetical protein
MPLLSGSCAWNTSCCEIRDAKQSAGLTSPRAGARVSLAQLGLLGGFAEVQGIIRGSFIGLLMTLTACQSTSLSTKAQVDGAFVQRIMQSAIDYTCPYTVHVSSTGYKALRLWDEHPDEWVFIAWGERSPASQVSLIPGEIYTFDFTTRDRWGEDVQYPFLADKLLLLRVRKGQEIIFDLFAPKRNS